MSSEVSELKQNWLQAEYVVIDLQSQQRELADKIKSAITKGNAQGLPDLRREVIALETFELPMAQAAAAEAAAKFYDAEAET